MDKDWQSVYNSNFGCVLFMGLESSDRLQQWDTNNVQADEPFLCFNKTSIGSFHIAPGTCILFL
jgi:hypothetical protein